MTTGQRIKSLRLLHGLSQEDLATLVGLKKAAIHKYESEIVVNLKRKTIAKLATALQTTPAYLMGWEDEAPAISFDDGVIQKILANQDLYRLAKVLTTISPEAINRVEKALLDVISE